MCIKGKGFLGHFEQFYWDDKFCVEKERVEMMENNEMKLIS